MFGNIDDEYLSEVKANIFLVCLYRVSFRRDIYFDLLKDKYLFNFLTKY